MLLYIHMRMYTCTRIHYFFFFLKNLISSLKLELLFLG